MGTQKILGRFCLFCADSHQTLKGSHLLGGRKAVGAGSWHCAQMADLLRKLGSLRKAHTLSPSTQAKAERGNRSMFPFICSFTHSVNYFLSASLVPATGGSVWWGWRSKVTRAWCFERGTDPVPWEYFRQGRWGMPKKRLFEFRHGDAKSSATHPFPSRGFAPTQLGSGPQSSVVSEESLCSELYILLIR